MSEIGIGAIEGAAFKGDGGNAAIALSQNDTRQKLAQIAPLGLLPVAFVAFAIFNGLAVIESFQRQDVPRILQSSSWVDGSGPRLAEAFFSGGSVHSALVNEIVVWKRLSGLTDGGEGARLGKEGRLFFGDNFNIPENVSAQLDVGMERVTSAIDILEQHGTEVTMVVLPSKAEIEREHLFWPVFADRARDARIEFLARLNGRQIAAVDAFEAFIEAKKTGDATGPNDMHWTVGGARAVASAVGAFMGRSAANDVELLAGEEQMVQGDLAGSISGGFPVDAEYTRSYPMQPYLAVHKDGVELAPGFEDAQVVVLGASSTQNDLFSFANFLRYELQVPIANMATWGRGPFHPMDLALAEFERTGHYPDRLIWEFSIVSLFDHRHVRGALDELPE